MMHERNYDNIFLCDNFFHKSDEILILKLFLSLIILLLTLSISLITSVLIYKYSLIY